MMTSKEIYAASAALGNQLAAGISLAEATRRMSRLQPKYAEFWDSVADHTANGRSLSSKLVDVWPEAIVNALQAGESSARLPDVFESVQQAIEQEQIVAAKMRKLLYPLGILTAGLAAFIFYMAKVMPDVAKNLGSGKKGFVLQLSDLMAKTLDEYWIGISIGLAATIIAVVVWLNNPANRSVLVDACLKLPVLNKGITSLYFGLWAKYMDLVAEAGTISNKDGIALTTAVLPKSLQYGMELFASEMVLRGMSDAADGEKQDDGDPRREWPFYVANCFLVADQTGDLAKELRRTAPILIKEGTEHIERFISIANVFATVCASVMGAIPMAAYYTQLAESLSGAMK